MTICRGALMFPALPEKPLSGWNGHQPELAATVLCREPISEELHKLRGRGCHILVSVVKGDVSRPFDPAQLLGFLGVREGVRGHPRGDGVGSYDHEQRARCDHGDKPERIEARYAIDAIPGKELG